nr:hypothetical protein [Campylobacter ureolyticus]
MTKATLTFGMDLSEFNTAFNKINRILSHCFQTKKQNTCKDNLYINIKVSNFYLSDRFCKLLK